MVLFGQKLSKIESQLLDNMKKTKAVFPQETQTMELGLNLMRVLMPATQGAAEDYKKRPNLFANQNLFARNIQLLLNAYFCLLSSSYGTLLVVLRAVLENNYLMRLFNEEPLFAFEWLPKEIQKQFSEETNKKYGNTGISGRRIDVDLNKRMFKDIATKKVRNDISKIFVQLCDYVHPNFNGWQELIVQKSQNSIILNIPSFQGLNTEKCMGVTLYSMQLSFKAFYETFKEYLTPFALPLGEWQDNYNKQISKYSE